MKNKLLNKLLIAAILTLSLTAFAQAQSATSLVTSLYKEHKKDSIAGWSKARLNKYFTTEFTNAFHKEANKEFGIEFDILFDTQDDSDIKTYKITSEKASGKRLEVITVSFKNFGESKKVLLTIDAKTKKIRNINYAGQKPSLMDMFKN
jgi:maltose-binding protein MalE